MKGVLVQLTAPKGFHTGKLERRNPLPAGRYWIDIFTSGQLAWQFWVMYAYPHLHIEKTEHYEGDFSLGYESRDWILFTTDAPLTWDLELSKKIGWPNTAPKSIQTSDDTVNKPDPESLFGDGPGLKIAIAGVGIVVAAVALGYVARSFR